MASVSASQSESERALAEADARAGNADRALARLAPLDRAGDAEATFLMARIEESLGRFAAARDRLLQLRARIGTSTAPLELQLASACQRLGDAPAAIAALEAALALKPDSGAAYKNLVAILAAQGRMDDVRAALARAVAALPADGSLWVRYATVHSHFGDAHAALSCLEKAVASMPPDAPTWRDIGYSYAEHWRYEEADRALALAAAIDPGDPDTEGHRAFVKQELGDTAGAAAALQAAAARDPDDVRVAVNLRLMLPQVYDDAADVARWRARFTEGMASLERDMGRWLPRAARVFNVNHNNFLLAYQGEDDTGLQRRYSAFLAQLLAAARPQWRAGRARTFDGSRKLRVGFAGSIFRECTAGRYFERWITGLDPRRFERFVYHTAPLADEFTQRIARAVEHFQTLRLPAADTAARIYDDALDVIVYPEVGMNNVTYVLAALKLAPVQCAGWGHPVTTGSDAIDAYFTAQVMEPPDGASHYTERLVGLPGIGVDYSMPQPGPALTRAQLGLPEDCHAYYCVQSLFKIHPEMDGLFADVVAADPRAVLVFFVSTGKRVTEKLVERFQRAFAARGVTPRRQLKFLPRMETPHFRGALAAADVVLDTVRWSGGNTSIDAFAAGVPVVTLPGRFMRGRQTAGMLELMQMPGLVAANAADYVRLAVDIASDRDRGGQLRKTIAERRSVLFDRPEAVQAFGDALLAIAAV
jgi:protein O-GlcNAc transferase